MKETEVKNLLATFKELNKSKALPLPFISANAIATL